MKLVITHFGRVADAVPIDMCKMRRGRRGYARK
jgi:hypothetical protein